MNSFLDELNRLFERHRVVFWYDEDVEFGSEFENLLLPNVTSLVVRNNEFGVKHRVTRQEPNQKFLIYMDGEQPNIEENWLLDLQLYSGNFKADQMSLWIAEVGIPPSLVDFCRAHKAFFKNASRRLRLKQMVKPSDDEPTLTKKMIAAVFGSDARLEETLGKLLVEVANNATTSVEALTSVGLADAWWKMLAEELGYNSQTRGPQDLALSLFSNLHKVQIGETGALKDEAGYLLTNFRDKTQNQEAFEKLSKMFSTALNIKAQLWSLNLRQLLAADLFYEVDDAIINMLARQFSDGGLKIGTIEEVFRERKPKFWFNSHNFAYTTLRGAVGMLNAIDQAFNTPLTSIQHGIQKYAADFYRVDQCYRQTIQAYSLAKYPPVLADVIEKVERAYNNDYLQKLGNQWTQVLDISEKWYAGTFLDASRFYEHKILPITNANKKVAVIISDALRYEAGVELSQRLSAGGQFDTTIEATLSALPSYTQLGMAAMLPHTKLSITEDGSASAKADGKPTIGMDNRQDILRSAYTNSACVPDEQILNANPKQLSELVSANNVLYVYHNQIDAIGDKIATEENVFSAVEDTFDRISNLVEKLRKAGSTNIIITTDHGFIYQNRTIVESDYSAADIRDLKLTTKQRRFVIGTAIGAKFGLHVFTAKQLGLEGSAEFGFATGYSRLRLSGSGSRYVHGGTSLQEVVIPVIRLKRVKGGQPQAVDVSVLQSGQNMITTAQISFKFYQEQAVDDEHLEREIRIALYARDGEVISDTVALLFNFSSSNPREREHSAKLMLNNSAKNYNDQDVYLRMMEPAVVMGVRTDQTRQFGTDLTFRLRQSITPDF